MSIHTRYLLHEGISRALWPEHKPEKDVLALQRHTPIAIWETTYQGNPSPPGGSIFHRSWWLNKNRYRQGDVLSNDVVARWQSWDTAMKDKDGAAYTVCLTGELWADYRMAICHVFRERLDFPLLPDIIAKHAEYWNRDGKLYGVIIEDRASGISAFQTLTLTAPEWLVALLIPFSPYTSKTTRAEQSAVYCKNDCVLLPEPHPDAPWLFPFEEEIYAAPSGVYMDQVDTLSQLVLYTEHYLATGMHFREQHPPEHEHELPWMTGMPVAQGKD